MLLRVLLALPAFLLNSTYGRLLWVIALLGWFACLVTGGMSRGLRNVGALTLRYAAQINGYMLLLTDAHPYSGPVAPVPAAPMPGMVSSTPSEPSI